MIMGAISMMNASILPEDLIVRVLEDARELIAFVEINLAP